MEGSNKKLQQIGRFKKFFDHDTAKSPLLQSVPGFCPSLPL